jgi:NAD(P)H-nitrite reductase large subunit
MIATGSTPFVPAIPGLKSVPNAFTFMSADDALEIKNIFVPTAVFLFSVPVLLG